MNLKKRNEPDELDEYKLRDIVAGTTKPKRVRLGKRTSGDVVPKVFATEI